jgi:uracil-DNA glycosylase
MINTILFIGSNPSNASTCEVAFHGTAKSSHILTEWTKDVNGVKMHINVLNKKTENNRPLKASEIKENIGLLAENIKVINPTRIVALGKTASKALTLLQVDFYEMPHPSGRNRLLNDPKYVEEKIKGLVQFCNQTSPSAVLI